MKNIARKLIVKYDNGLNKVALRGFKPIEKDLFATLCAVVKEKGTDKITFDFDKLRELSNYDQTSLDRFTSDLKSTNKKLMSLNFEFEDEHKIIQFVLFPTFEIDKDNKTLEISVHEKFQYLLNDIDGNFTKFELQEFVKLKSTYAKDLYRLLKQFRLTGFCYIGIEEFRRLMDVPKSYAISDIDKKVLNTAIIEELKQYFIGLNIEKEYEKKRGKPIKAFIFRFQREDDIKNGKGTFRDEDGYYYDKDLIDFTSQDVESKFPEAPEYLENIKKGKIINENN